MLYSISSETRVQRDQLWRSRSMDAYVRIVETPAPGSYKVVVQQGDISEFTPLSPERYELPLHRLLKDYQLKL